MILIFKDTASTRSRVRENAANLPRAQPENGHHVHTQHNIALGDLQQAGALTLIAHLYKCAIKRRRGSKVKSGVVSKHWKREV